MIEPLVGLALIVFGALLAYRTTAWQRHVTHLMRADQDPTLRNGSGYDMFGDSYVETCWDR